MTATAPTVSLPADLLERFVRAVEKLETLGLSVDEEPSTDGLLTTAQVAKRLGGTTSVRTVQRLVKDGKLRKVPGLGKKTTRFRLADVDRLVADQETKPGRRRL